MSNVLGLRSPGCRVLFMVLLAMVGFSGCKDDGQAASKEEFLTNYDYELTFSIGNASATDIQKVVVNYCKVVRNYEDCTLEISNLPKGERVRRVLVGKPDAAIEFGRIEVETTYVDEKRYTKTFEFALPSAAEEFQIAIEDRGKLVMR